MIRSILTAVLCTCCTVSCLSQVRYAGKVEAGYLSFQRHMVRVDPGPEWKGYYLQEGQNGFELNAAQGVRFRDRLFAGIGAGYMNFNGVHGVSLFLNTQLAITKRTLRPVINTRFGYSHLWNQYADGTGTLMAEATAGMEYVISKRYSVHLSAGMLVMQQSLLYPLRVGFVF
jgi:hypothetical protein